VRPLAFRPQGTFIAPLKHDYDYYYDYDFDYDNDYYDYYDYHYGAYIQTHTTHKQKYKHTRKHTSLYAAHGGGQGAHARAHKQKYTHTHAPHLKQHTAASKVHTHTPFGHHDTEHTHLTISSTRRRARCTRTRHSGTMPPEACGPSFVSGPAQVMEYIQKGSASAQVTHVAGPAEAMERI
jgi:hypothetical protein